MTDTRDEHPFGFALHEMDVEAFWNMRQWLQKAVEAAGAKVTGSGIGMGRADIDIELDGCRYNVSIKPLLNEAQQCAAKMRKWRKENDGAWRQPPSPPASVVTEWVKAAKVCRDTYCELVPGKRTWDQLSDAEKQIDAVCIKAAFGTLTAALSRPASAGVGEEETTRARIELMRLKENIQAGALMPHPGYSDEIAAVQLIDRVLSLLTDARPKPNIFRAIAYGEKTGDAAGVLMFLRGEETTELVRIADGGSKPDGDLR